MGRWVVAYAGVSSAPRAGCCACACGGGCCAAGEACRLLGSHDMPFGVGVSVSDVACAGVRLCINHFLLKPQR